MANLFCVLSFSPLRGVGAVVIGAGPAHAMYFSSYEFSKEALAKVSTNNHINYSESLLRFSSFAPKLMFLFSHCSMCRSCGDSNPRRYLESDRGDQAATADVQFAVPVRHTVHEQCVQTGGSSRVLPVILHAVGHELAVPGDPLLHVRVHPEPPEQGPQIQSSCARGRRRVGGSDSGGCDYAPGRREDPVEHSGDRNWSDEDNVAGDCEGMHCTRNFFIAFLL